MPEPFDPGDARLKEIIWLHEWLDDPQSLHQLEQFHNIETFISDRILVTRRMAKHLIDQGEEAETAWRTAIQDCITNRRRVQD